MPELPEVEIVARNLRSWAGGKRLSAVDLRDSSLLAEPTLRNGLVGRTLTSVQRRAKHLVAHLDDEALIFHFRMTGKLVQVEAEEPRFLRMLMSFEDGTRVGFKDQRRLGTVLRLPSEQVEAFFLERGLGPEPWPEARDGLWWQERYRGSRGPLKPALMVQERVAGLGNILATEICWQARLDPQAPTSGLDQAQWQRVAQATKSVIERTLSLESGPEVHYLAEAGASRTSPFSVYGREGLGCPRCQSPIARFRQSGRSTFWCAPCQTR